MTAAHCSEGALQIQVIAGVHNRVVPEPSQMSQFVLQYYENPAYNPVTLANDISMMIVPIWWPTNDFIQWIQPDFGGSANRLVGTLATASGFGVTENGQLSDVLRYTRNRIISNAECAAVYGITVVNSAVICTETAESNRGFCGGDTGGPLISDDPEVFGQVGIMSFTAGAGCVAG
jgi:secreted trypsin-like serine protease